MTDRFRDRLSEYRDGELTADEERLVRSHLEGCSECAAILDDLEAVVEQAGELTPIAPETDLWDGIETRLAAGVRLAPDGPATPARRPGVRRIALTVPQLAAAAIALATLSSAGAWMALGGGSEARIAGVAPVQDASLVSAASDEGADEYGDVIAELERALFDPANTLPPETEASLRAALLKIDRAIEDARLALEKLPGDAYLEDHVESTLRRKADFLRHAVRLSRS